MLKAYFSLDLSPPCFPIVGYRPSPTCCACVVVDVEIPPLLVKPSNSPRIPRGLGTGHSWPALANLCASSSNCRNVDTSSSAAGCVWPSGLPSWPRSSSSFRRRLRILWLGCPSADIIISESANVRRGAGQGKTCGRPTTTKEARSVPAKREDVDRDRGCRCGGMLKYGCEQLRGRFMRSGG